MFTDDSDGTGEAGQDSASAKDGTLTGVINRGEKQKPRKPQKGKAAGLFSEDKM